MIRVSCRLGDFEITDGQIDQTDGALRDIFDIVSESGSFGPEKGPIDYAIAIEMVDKIGGDFEINDQEYGDDVDETNQTVY